MGQCKKVVVQMVVEKEVVVVVVVVVVAVVSEPEYPGVGVGTFDEFFGHRA